MNYANLKILVVLPLYGGSLPIGQYCVSALQEMNCNVRCFEAQHLFSAYKGFKSLDLTPERSNKICDSFLKLVSQAAVSMAEEFEPHIVLALAQAPLDKYALLKLKQKNFRTVMWFVEDYKVLEYWRIYAPLYDAFAVIQKEPFLTELKKIGQPYGFYLPLAALPDFHKPLKLTEEEKKIYGSAISFLGAGYPNRRLAFRRLADRDFKIWGNDWDGEQTLKRNLQRPDERIEPEESVKIYNASKINLNLHSGIKTDRLVSGGDFVNPRTFELAAMGAFQLVDKRSLLGELFEADELATFENIEDFYRLIDYFLAHPEEAELYAEKSRARVLKDHTYQKRMTLLIEYMQKNFGPLGAAKEDNEVLKELPEDIREKLSQLEKRLGLGDDPSFETIIGKLRQQTGKLDEVETSLLFLDEWRKQYTRKS